VRLRTVAPGVAVGGGRHVLRSPRPASVVAEEPSRLYRLSRWSLEEMDARDPELAAELYKAFATLLARRLTDSLEAAEVLLE
jgi:SulP family sulfate permease